MGFKEMKGNKTVEACVAIAPGGMFKGYVRTVTQRGTQTFDLVTGRRCGRPMPTFDAAMALAEEEAKRILGI
jgi:hypothetical protein